MTGKRKPATIFRLIALLRPERRAYVAVCTFGLINAFLEMIPPRLIGGAVDGLGAGSFDLRAGLTLAGTWLAVAVVTQLLHGLQIRLANGAGERILSRLRISLFEHLQRVPMAFYDRTHPGRILATMGNDLDSFRGVLIWGVNTLIANAAIMLLAAVMILRTDTRLFLATAWLAPLMTALNFHYGKKVTRAWQDVRRHSSLVGSNQAENIAGAKVVAAFNRQARNLAVFNDLQATNTRNNVAASAKSGLFQPLLQWIRFCGVAIILTYGGYRVSHGNLRAGDLVAVLLYWEWFMSPAINFGAFFNDLLVSLTGAERVFQILDVEPQDEAHLPPLPEIGGRVRFESVAFRYHRSGRDTLKGVDFEVAPGSVVAIVGETGGGKSTIMSLLARFYRPTSGRILVDGHDLSRVSGESYHRQTAMVLQTNFLFSGTLRENLRYGRPGASDEELFAAARTLGCHERFLALKNGYDTDVGERGSALSLGERQLACFTRALVRDPRILLLDEATSALDSRTGIEVQRALRRLVKGRTTFIITHRLSTVTDADVILVVDDGRIRELGRHHELLRAGGVYAELYANSFTRPSSRFAGIFNPKTSEAAAAVMAAPIPEKV